MVTVLAGVIAVLGTSIAFLSSDSLGSFFGDVGRTFAPAQTEPVLDESQLPVQQPIAPVEEEEQPVEIVEQIAIQCDALDVSGEQPMPHTGEDCFTISNVHTWVNKIPGRINERTATAFVVQNTGTKDITISSIKVKDVAVLSAHWFFTTEPSIVKPANLGKDLQADYTENVVAVGGGLAVMKSGAISLAPGQVAIVYLDEAGGLIERDAGTIVTVQVQAGMIQVEKAVTVVRA